MIHLNLRKGEWDAMTAQWLPALLLFLLAYGLIALRGIPGTKIGRPGAALIGGLLMAAFGILAVADVPKYINADLLLLLLGMMLLVGGLEYAGFFDLVAGRLLASGSPPAKFMAEIMVLCAFLSAVMLNDAVVLLMTPITVRCCSKMKINPIPYLIGVFVSSNIGSAATAVGNPQNAYVAMKAGIGFLDFAAYAIPIAIISLIIAAAMIRIMTGNSGDFKFSADAGETPVRETDSLRLKVMMGLLIGTVAAFALSDIMNVSLHMIAIASGLLSLCVVSSKGIGAAKWAVKRVNWSVLVFFIGLFLLMGGAIESGLLDTMASAFGFGDGNSPSIPGLVLFTALLSNLFSNVPAVMLIGEMIPPDAVYWMALAISSTLAGNATLMGAAANIIVAEEAEKCGIRVDFWKTVKIGLPITAVTLIIALLYLTIIF